MHPFFRRLLLVTVALVGLAPGPASAADDDAPWAVSTASNAFGSDRPNYSYTVNPGGQVEDGVVVANRGSSAIDLAVYAADAFTTSAGRLDLTTPDTPSDDIGSWVQADRDHVRVEPGKTVEVPFTIAVPKDAAPGDHVGGIVTSTTETDPATGGTVDRRLALRIRLRVGGELRPGLAVEHVAVDYSGTANPLGKGDGVVSYTLRNTGNTILAARQSAYVTGPFGAWKVPAAAIADSPALLPGETWKVSAPVDGVRPAVRVSATVTALPLLTDAAGSTGVLATVASSGHSWDVPWALLAVIALVALAVVVTVVRRRGRRLVPQVSEPSASGSTALASSLRSQ